MEKLLPIIKLFLDKIGEHFWWSIFLTGLSIFIFYKTRYPNIFRLIETNSGAFKLIILLLLLIAFFQIILPVIANIHYSIKNAGYEEGNGQEIIKNINNIINNASLYPIESHILSILYETEIEKFNCEALQRYFISNLEKRKKPNVFNPQIDNDIAFFRGYEGIEKIDNALSLLSTMKIINVVSIDLYEPSSCLSKSIKSQKEQNNVANN